MPDEPRHFLEQIIDADNAAGKWGQWSPAECTSGQTPGTPRVHTRFPPEPNGYLHIGHAKSICLNYGLAEQFGGKFNLRFDDTNPSKEEQEYVDAIKEDVAWLGGAYEGKFGGGIFWASDYFAQMYAWAEELVTKGLAYVCDLNAEQMSQMRGDLKTPARSPHRERSPQESLDLLRRMKAGEFPDGAKTLRAVAEDDSVRVVVLTGTGKSFCAGEDLRAHAGNLHGAVEHDSGQQVAGEDWPHGSQSTIDKAQVAAVGRQASIEVAGHNGRQVSTARGSGEENDLRAMRFDQILDDGSVRIDKEGGQRGILDQVHDVGAVADGLLGDGFDAVADDHSRQLAA